MEAQVIQRETILITSFARIDESALDWLVRFRWSIANNYPAATHSSARQDRRNCSNYVCHIYLYRCPDYECRRRTQA